MTLAIFVGIWAEERAVCRHIEVLDEREIEGMPVKLGSYREKAVLVCRTGLGEERMNLVGQGIFGDYSPRTVVSFRIAPSLPDHIALGDYVICRETHLWRAPGELTRASRESDARLLVLAEHAAARAGRPHVVMKALTISPMLPAPGNRSDARSAPSLGVIDTEGYWLAEMAHVRGLPFLSVRAALGDALDRSPEVVALASRRGKVNRLRYLTHTASNLGRLPDLLALPGAIMTASRSLSAFTREFLDAWAREP
jgi:nucleoside phosphorylase